MKTVALVLNGILVGCELYALGHIRGKWNILKYYTYLQNFLAMIAGLILVVSVILGGDFSEFVRGLRYITTCGLAAVTFIFVVFLGSGKKAPMTREDFLPGCSPGRANFLLHYLCPAISVLSFVVFERETVLSNGIWTSAAALPSCGYWIVYAILSTTGAWEEPYDFTTRGKKNKVLEALVYLSLPLSFVAISFVLWNIR